MLRVVPRKCGLLNSMQGRSTSSWAEAGAAQAFSRSQAWEKHHPEL